MKLLLVDIDGTVTTTVSGETFKQHPHDVKVIEGVVEALSFYQQQDWLILGVSNQGGVAAGKKSVYDVYAEMMYTLKLLPQIQCIYFCPDFEGRILGWVNIDHADCKEIKGYKSFRKPSPGMIEYILSPYGVYELFEEILMVGDRPEDEKCAENIGINFLFAEKWLEGHKLPKT